MNESPSQILRTTFGHRLEEDTLDILRAAATRASYPVGTAVCREGERGDTFYVIASGQIAATQRTEDGGERLLNLLGPGDYFGEMALIDNTPRMATCTAVTAVTLLEVTESTFDELMAQSPTVAFSLSRRILRTLREHDARAIEDLRAKNRELRRAYTELQAAQAQLVEKERLERELELASDVQRSLLPGSLPNFSDYAFAAHLQPARSVGGDMYDVIELDDEHVGLLLADVADKGLHAALFMAVAHTLFRREARRHPAPAEVALAVHEGLFDVATTRDVFVTAFYGVLHRPTGRLTYVRAAQERPLLLRPGAPPETLQANGRFLGMLPDLMLREDTVHLRPGDRLIVFSDGIPDAINPASEPYGYERLARCLTQHAALPADRLARELVADVHAWVQDAPTVDDLTLLVVEAR